MISLGTDLQHKQSISLRMQQREIDPALMEVRNLPIISIEARLVLIDHIVDQWQNKSLRLMKWIPRN